MKYVLITLKESLKLVDDYDHIDFLSSFEEIRYFNEKFGLKYADFQGNNSLTLDCYYEIIDEKKFAFACIEHGICPKLIESLEEYENRH
jgi:hypothetical protein